MQNLILKDQQRPSYSFRVRSLICWQKHETKTWKSRFLLGLKGGGAEKTLSTLASWFCMKNLDLSFQKRVFVPAPAKKSGEEDHAYCWAKALAEFTGGRLESNLKRVDQGSQKKKSVGERRQTRTEIVTRLQSKDPIVFVDDIIASGSTALAAIKALGEEENIEVWTLAFRPKLAEKQAL